MRLLITGSRGFVGRHLHAHATSLGWDVLGLDREDVDIRSTNGLESIISEWSPDAVCHLAAQSSVAQSFAEPTATFDVNVLGTVSLLEAVHKRSPTARVLVASSADVYAVRTSADLPLREDGPIAPVSPYAASKLAQEIIALQYRRAYDLRVVITRSFNAIGPGQGVEFALPSFAHQLASIARGEVEPILHVGNLDTERDFVDVRDVVRAQLDLLGVMPSDEVFNICSGLPFRLRDALDTLIDVCGVPVRIQIDASRLRPVEVPTMYGSNERIRAATNWFPEIAISQTLHDLYHYMVGLDDERNS